MISPRWLEKRKLHWARLEELVERAGRNGISTLALRELRELGLLYRQTASDLATAREDAAGGNLAAYLNHLLGRAHNLLYMSRRSEPGGIARFYIDTYPRIFRETLPYTLAAFVLFLAAAAAGLLLSFSDPSFQRFLLGPRMMESIEQRQMWTHSILTVKPLASSSILTNNLMVAFMAFAAGITAGLGTVYMMLLNGLLIGVVGAACWQAGMSVALWSFVAPHGVLELPAIFLAGGAGLLLGRGLLFPGPLSRRDSLAQAGSAAVRLVLGAVPLLIVAGVIEGFLSPTALPAPLKFGFAAALGALLTVYLAQPARARDVTGNRPSTSNS